jgi:hypothetical protein
VGVIEKASPIVRLFDMATLTLFAAIDVSRRLKRKGL